MVVLLEVPELSAFAVAMLLVMFAYAYRYTLGALLDGLAQVLNSVSLSIPYGPTIRPFAFGAAVLEAINNTVYASIGGGITACEWAYHKLVHYQGYALQEIGTAIGDLAYSTWQALDTLAHGKMPASIQDAINGSSALVSHSIARLRGQVGAAERTLGLDIAAAERAAQTVERVALARLAKVEQDVKLAERDTLSIVEPQIKAIDHDIARLTDGVKSLAQRLSFGALIALVGATFFRAFDLGWLRCRGVGTLGKKLCGLSGIIESLFLDAVDALALLNLCYLIEEMTAVAAHVSPVVTEYGAQLNDLLKCRGIHPPAGPRLGTTALPVPVMRLTFGKSAP